MDESRSDQSGDGSPRCGSRGAGEQVARRDAVLPRVVERIGHAGAEEAEIDEPERGGRDRHDHEHGS